MKNIVIREAHASLMLEITALSTVTRHLMEAATGLMTEKKITLANTELVYSAEHITAISKMLKLK
jgi:hypothetical protein